MIAAVLGTLVLSALGYALVVGLWARTGTRSRGEWTLMIVMLVAIEAVFLILQLRS